MSRKREPILEHELRMFGCLIRHDLENTVAELTDPDGIGHPFNATVDEPNATLQAIRWAKVDQAAREQAAADKRKADRQAAAEQSVERPVEQAEVDDPTDIESEGDA